MLQSLKKKKKIFLRTRNHTKRVNTLMIVSFLIDYLTVAYEIILRGGRMRLSPENAGPVTRNKISARSKRILERNGRGGRKGSRTPVREMPSRVLTQCPKKEKKKELCRSASWTPCGVFRKASLAFKSHISEIQKPNFSKDRMCVLMH